MRGCSLNQPYSGQLRRQTQASDSLIEFTECTFMGIQRVINFGTQTKIWGMNIQQVSPQ